MFEGKVIIVGVTGGIGAYKIVDLVSKLTQRGAEVHVIMTEAAREFVTPLTFETLSRHRVICGLFDRAAVQRHTGLVAEVPEFEIDHVALTDRADCFVVAPATANIIAKMSNGIADDALSTFLVAAECPIVVAPAMNTRMWENPITQENAARLKRLGCRFAGPEVGRLASGAIGAGRLVSNEEIMYVIEDALAGRPADLSGVRVLVTSGPTREYIDPVRFISAPSTGKMGDALARAALCRGAEVTLVTGPTGLPGPAAARRIDVVTTGELFDAVMAEAERTDVFIGAAAPADYTVDDPCEAKLKAEDNERPAIRLRRTGDVAAAFGAKKGDRVAVVFAAETHDLLANAKEKLRKKNADLIVANDVTQEGAGFGSDTNIVTLIRANGETIQLPRMSKREVAERVLDEVVAIRRQRGGECGG
ncbi:MAG: bifunctional phosphopantothenoylcysteine decarboxylase/phosphopantothenate--cysteine ligase CoaBC [Armatimonadota bacterium]